MKLILFCCVLGALFHVREMRQYGHDEEIATYYGSVAPYYNWQEVYDYYRISSCGDYQYYGYYRNYFTDDLQGEHKQTFLDYSHGIKFKADKNITTYCTTNIYPYMEVQLRQAVMDDYWYKLYIEDLPVWGKVGEYNETSDEAFVFTHRKLDIGHNKHQIVEVNLTSSGRIKAQSGRALTMTYEVHWRPSPIEFEHRWYKYTDPRFLIKYINSMSMICTCVVAIVLISLIRLIQSRNRLKNSEDLLSKEEMEHTLVQDCQWDKLQDDVFRPPKYPMLFSSLVASGYHAFVLAFIVLSLDFVIHYCTWQGTSLFTSLIVFCILAPLNGYCASSMYARMGGKKWVRQLMVSTLMLPIIVWIPNLMVMFVAMYNRTLWERTSYQIDTLLEVLFYAVFPLTLLGTIAGKLVAAVKPDHLCQVHSVPRPIPATKWFMKTKFLLVWSGILPFAAVFIQIYFALTAVWQRRIFDGYFFLLSVIALLEIFTACVAYLINYCMMKTGDYRWQWRCFIPAISSSIYIFLYSIYFFYYETKFYGYFQTFFYFSYMALICILLAIINASFSFSANNKFLRNIYQVRLEEMNKKAAADSLKTETNGKTTVQRCLEEAGRKKNQFALGLSRVFFKLGAAFDSMADDKHPKSTPMSGTVPTTGEESHA